MPAEILSVGQSLESNVIFLSRNPKHGASIVESNKQGWWYLSHPHLLVPYGWYSHQMDALGSCLSVTNYASDVLNEANQHAHLLLRVVIDPDSFIMCVCVCFHMY